MRQGLASAGAARTLVDVPPLTPGYRLHGRFVLAAPAGAGGMSQVWRASDEVLGRPVAVKMLTTAIATDPVLREATWREARAAARLTHPNVTQIYDYGEATLPDGERLPYLVMELVDGTSLADRLVAGPLPWQQAARVGAETAAALAAAHQVGVVHHDIKPGNVMLTAHGAKVLDFGIAALAGAASGPAALAGAAGGPAAGTAGGPVLVGTPTYTAPQRLAGAAADPADDVYSLGVLLYELLAGRPPIRLRDWDEARAAHQAGIPPPPLPGVPANVTDVVSSCLQADAGQRPTARQVAASLAEAAHSPDPAATLPAAPPAVAALRYSPGAAAVPTTPLAPARQTEPTRVGPLAPARSRRGLMLAGVAVLAALLALLLAVLALPRAGTTPDTAGEPGSTDQAESAETGTTGQAETDDEAGDEVDDGDVASGPLGREREIIAQVDAAIRTALETGLIDADAAEDLWDELDDLREELEKDYAPGERRQKIREAARDLREEIEDLLDDQEVPPSLADQLSELLQPLLRGNPG